MSLRTLTPDEESRSCVQRERRLDGFGDEILELRAQAWPCAGDTSGESRKWPACLEESRRSS